jgi:hypothetical protein
MAPNTARNMARDENSKQDENSAEDRYSNPLTDRY